MSLYEEVSLYWKFAYPSDPFPPSMSQLLATNLSHPLLDISWIDYQIKLFKLLEGKSGIFPTKLSISFSRFFDSVWYASILYDAGIQFPDSLYNDWLRRGLPKGVTVLTSDSTSLSASLPKEGLDKIFSNNSNVEDIWSKLGVNEDSFLVTTSWKVLL